MARLSPEERREAIVEAALTVARRQGLASTTVRDVATEMGTSSGLVHHYFDSMDEVLAEAFALAASVDLDLMRSRLAQAADPLAAMAVFHESYAPVESDWTFQLWLDAWSEAARRPALRATSARLNIAWQEMVAEVVTSGTAAGVFGCPDPEAAAWRIISLLDGLVLQVVAHGTTVSRERLLAWARASTEIELGLDPGTLGG